MEKLARMPIVRANVWGFGKNFRDIPKMVDYQHHAF
jgi:hypothetical protein